MSTALALLACTLFLEVPLGQSQANEDFQGKLEQHAATHTRQEVAAYAQTLIQQVTFDAEHAAFVVNGVLLGDGVLLSDGVVVSEPLLLSDEMIACLQNNGIANTFHGQYCVANQWKACHHAYLASVHASAARASQVLATCTTNTSTTGFLQCAAGALNTHASLIRTAKSQRGVCAENALQSCQLQ